MSFRFRNVLVLSSFVCVVAVLLTGSVHAQAQARRWVRLAPFPNPSEELYGTAVNGKMYVIGGYADHTGMVFEYDPAADKWTRKKDMARPVHHQAMVALNGKIYVIGGFLHLQNGGWEPVDSTWEYDPATDAWKALAPMPMKRGSAVAAEVGGKIYVFGGATTYPSSKLSFINGAGPALVLTVNQVYDPATNTWAERAPMSVGRNHAYAGAVNGKIYVVGGRIGHAFVTASSNTDVVEEYDPATDTYGPLKAKIPTPRSGGGWAVHNGRIYIAGGEVATAQMVGAFRAIEVYNPATNVWDTTFPMMPMPRHGVAGAVIGNRLYLTSGQITSAAAGGGQDPKMQLYTQVVDAIDLQ